MTALTRGIQMLLCFSVASLATYLPARANPAPAPQGGVDCTLIVKLCPGNTVSWQCIGDCAPFGGEICVMNKFGSWRWCACGKPTDEFPYGRLSPCSLFFDIAGGGWFCHDTDCLLTCDLTVSGPDAQGCYTFRCACL